MKMKPLAAIGAAIALMMGNPVANDVQQQQQQQQQNKKEATERNPVTVRQGVKTPLNPTGGQFVQYLNPGRAPKEYGQWLQHTGRQKWNKGGRK